ncbi:hypothetical protein ONZ45_g19159 [Pleurotus djamor]|nr:hypothetical protein ONZ45_g19159 [Pleurotus djamor]
MTPPLSSFDTGKSQQSSQALNPTVTPATPATPGIKLPASFSFSNTTPASSPFGQSNAPSPFGAPPPAFPSSPSPFGASPLGAPSSGFSGFGTPPQPKQPPAPSAFNPPPPPPRQTPTIEDGMQAECMRLFSVLGKELEELKTMSQMAVKQREDFAKSSGTHSKADLRTPEKWGGLNDVVPFGKAMKTLESDIKQKKQLMLKEHDFLRDIQDSMLKAGTRKEEIARFNRAKNDADFSQMLKSRTLGPEHHETQVHLRKSIRDIRDRVSKLEQTLQTSKSKLSRSNKGKPVLKPPSLATAHRTLQNIDIAIHQQATEIAGLSSRFARLDISSLGPSNPLLRSRLQYGSKQHAVATPNVAVTTAAALNSERCTHRLKDRLLRTRKEPLLNNKVTPPSHAPLAFSTPRATTTSPMPSITFTPPAGGADFSPGAYSPTPSVRRGAAFASKHYKSPAIKKASEQQTPSAFAPPAGFSWGPVPSFPPIKPLAAPIIPLKSPHTP